MAYCTTKQVIEATGTGNRVIDENVGTGDNSNAYFDLDHDNVISNTYTLSYAASGSNNFTALTETTHYTIPDLESGRIILTAAGITALGTNILYATYTHTDTLSDTVISSFITYAQAEVDKILGRTYDTVTSTSEYHDGRRTHLYPTTDNPYSADLDSPDFIMLYNYPVTQVNNVYFLENPNTISKFFNYDADLGTYTDKTNAVNDADAEFTLFASVPAANDIVYIGSENKFLGLDFTLSTLGTGTPAIDWEYYDGSSWSDITETEIDTNSSTFKASGKFVFNFPSNWTVTSVNSSSNLYFIRGKLTSGYTIAPICLAVSIKDSISQMLHPRDITFESYGKLIFLNNSLVDGTKNIRVDYKYGSASVPALVQEMTAILAGISVLLYTTGNSYDAATSYTIGNKVISIGEQYVNIREALDQMKKRFNEIRNALGGRAYITSI